MNMYPAGTELAATPKAATALGRCGKREEIAAAVAFPASLEAAFTAGAPSTAMAACPPEARRARHHENDMSSTSAAPLLEPKIQMLSVP